MATEVDKFLSNVVPEPNSGCWLWIGRYGGKGGYGQFKQSNFHRSVRAHRWAYEHFNGPIQDGLIVRHRCDVKQCVNPNHLLSGTVRDNALDCVRSGNHVSARKTICKNGHPLEAGNLVFRSNPRIRVCAICDKIYKQRNEAKNGKR